MPLTVAAASECLVESLVDTVCAHSTLSVQSSGARTLVTRSTGQDFQVRSVLVCPSQSE